MKTITEFPGVIIRQVLKSKQELVSSGTAEEQLSTSLGETFKIEGDRLNHLIKSIGMIGTNAERVARVRVFSGEDETLMPKGAVKEGEHFYLVELINLPSKEPKKEERRDGKKGKGDKKDGKKGRGGGGRDRDQSASRGDKSGPGGPGGAPRAPRENTGRPSALPVALGSPAPRVSPVAPKITPKAKPESAQPAVAAQPTESAETTKTSES